MLFYVIAMSMIVSASYHFSDQELFAQLAIVEVFFVLWFMKMFYEKAIPDAPQYKHDSAAKARVFFYFLLPFAFLDSFNQGLPEYILYGLWISCAISFVLAEFTKSKVILLEFLGLAGFAVLVSFIKINYFALLLGNALFFAVSYYKRSWEEAAFDKTDYQFIFLLTPYFAIASVSLI